MFTDWTFGRKVALGFAFAGAAILTLAVVGYQSTHRLIENDHWVNHTQQVRRSIADLLSLLKDAETGERGYIITGDETFLEPYRSALAGVDKNFDEVRTLTSDNDAQQRALAESRPLIDKKIAVLKTMVEQRRSGGAEAVNKAAIVEAKGVMDQL